MPSCWGVFSESPANCHVSCSTTRHNSRASPLVNSDRGIPSATYFTQNFEEIETPLIHGAERLPCFTRCRLTILCRALRSRIAHISGKLRSSLPSLGIRDFFCSRTRPPIPLERRPHATTSPPGIPQGGGARCIAVSKNVSNGVLRVLVHVTAVLA